MSKYRHSRIYYHSEHPVDGHFIFGELSGCTAAAVFITSATSGWPAPSRMSVEASIDGVNWVNIISSTVMTLLPKLCLIPNAGAYQVIRANIGATPCSIQFVSYWR
jgi:hypothetical protein